MTKTKDTIYTLPNLVTLIRLMLLPFFIYALANNSNQLALFLFVIIVITDKLDGYWARLHRQMTEIGRVFDGFTDGIVFLSTITALALLESYNLTLLWAFVLAMPKLITFLCGLFYVKREKRLEWRVMNKGRVGTALLYISLLMLIIKFEYTYIFLIVTAVVLYISAIEYINEVFFRKKKH